MNPYLVTLLNRFKENQKEQSESEIGNKKNQKPDGYDCRQAHGYINEDIQGKISPRRSRGNGGRIDAHNNRTRSTSS